MIAHTTWRDLFYKLAEAHPDCLMLNFTVKVETFFFFNLSVKSSCKRNVCFVADFRRRLPGRDHQRVDGVPATGGFLSCVEDIFSHAAGWRRGEPRKEPARICREAHLDNSQQRVDVVSMISSLMSCSFFLSLSPPPLYTSLIFGFI